MGYLFLAVSVLVAQAKGYFGKRVSGCTKTLHEAALASTLRMVLCAGVGFVTVIAAGGFGALAASAATLRAAALSGGATAAFVIIWLILVRRNAYMLPEIFSMLGVLIPLIASEILYGEQITLIQWLGIGVLFAAAFLMCFHSASIKGKITLPTVGLLFLYGIVCGLGDFSQKLFVKSDPQGSAAVFNFYTYLFATVLLVAASFFTRSKDERVDPALLRKIAGYIAIMAVSLFASAYFKTRAAAYLDAVLIFPLVQGANLLFAAGMSAIMFRERLTVKAVVGMVAAFTGLMMINLL